MCRLENPVLNKLYKERKFLDAKLKMQIETFQRTDLPIHLNAMNKTKEEIKANQANTNKWFDDI